MRQIGTVPTEQDARRLSDHLVSLGMNTRVDPQGDAWVIWIYNEDHIPRARQEFELFLKDPNDARYQNAKQSAEAIERQKKELDRQYRKNVRVLSGRWDRTNFRRRPLTIILVAISIFVYFSPFVLPDADSLTELFLFSSLELDGPNDLRMHGLDQILHGQIWRLITPIFLHWGPMHILFNMWAMLSFGTVIEYRRGTKLLAMLVLLSALASNVAEFTFELLTSPRPGYFGGMSGVGYALFGYVWMKGRNEPEQGMILHPRSVQWMLFWLVFCMTGYMGPIANVAHVAGMIVGMLIGLARF